jgi:hypothetical protein
MKAVGPFRIRTAVALFAVLVSVSSALAQSKNEDHQASIRGVGLGMSLVQVMDRLDPLPYHVQDWKDGTVLVCKLQDESTLQVHFREQRAVHISLRYQPPRPVADLLLELPFVSGNTQLTKPDPRLRRDYQIRERVDKSRIIWARTEPSGQGYDVEIGFLSASRAQQGDRYHEWVEFKYVTVQGEDLLKFDKAEQAQPDRKPPPAAPQTSEPEDHLPRIKGLEIGMTAQQVVDRIGRMPNDRKEENGQVVVSWILEDGGALQVEFCGEHVCHLGLQLKTPRPATDLWLVPISQAGSSVALTADEKAALIRRQEVAQQTPGIGTSLPAGVIAGSQTPPQTLGAQEGTTGITAADPRWRREYQVSRTIDRTRTLWSRQQKTAPGYHIEVKFLSPTKQQYGDRFEEFVEFKYVSVPEEDLEKFQRSFPQSPQP